MRNIIRKIMPRFFLEKFRTYKKQKVRNELKLQKKDGNVLSKENLKQQFKEIGIKAGDTLMVHSAMSKIGYLENGPETLVSALLDTIGSTGHLLMPSSPVKMLQLDYIKINPIFNVLETPSAMGAVTEYFRKLEGVIRSAHPTESVCVFGKNAAWFVENHFGQITPYNNNSPWYKTMQQNGKILYIGTTLINSGTHLHVLEDAVNFKYPVYTDEIFNATVIHESGIEETMQTKVHNPEFSKRRRCDELISLFKAENVLEEVKIGQAKTLLLNAEGMLKTMLKAYAKNGVTMYTPNGEKIKDYE